MTQGKELEELLREFERVGVDPNTLSAGLAVPPADAMRALHSLPDGAGPTAFLARLREYVAAHSAHADREHEG